MNNNKYLVLCKEYAKTQQLEFVVVVVSLDGGDGVIVHFEDTRSEQPEEIMACSVRILRGLLLSLPNYLSIRASI